ncbi:MAG: hypothetical protein ACK44W_03490, partial [Planctomycetota bacterium]
MSRVLAVCEEERGCPLYRRGARLEFAPPTVSGLEGLPVCATAVAALQKPAERVAAGQAAAQAVLARVQGEQAGAGAAALGGALGPARAGCAGHVLAADAD